MSGVTLFAYDILFFIDIKFYFFPIFLANITINHKLITINKTKLEYFFFIKFIRNPFLIHFL